AEPKYGLCVTGRVHPARLLIKGGLRSGDALFLSKPLGTGVITTAAKQEACEPAVLAAAGPSMLRLNRGRAPAAGRTGGHGATHTTGFGLLGHAAEMVDASGVGLAMRSRDLPLLPGAVALAEKGTLSGGQKRNRAHVEGRWGAGGRLTIDPSVPGALV